MRLLSALKQRNSEIILIQRYVYKLPYGSVESNDENYIFQVNLLLDVKLPKDPISETTIKKLKDMKSRLLRHINKCAKLPMTTSQMAKDFSLYFFRSGFLSKSPNLHVYCYLLEQLKYDDHFQAESELEAAFSNELWAKIVSSWLPVRNAKMDVRFKEGVKVFLKDEKVTKAILNTLSQCKVQTICNFASEILHMACNFDDKFDRTYSLLFGKTLEPFAEAFETMRRPDRLIPALQRVQENPIAIVNRCRPVLENLVDDDVDELEECVAFCIREGIKVAFNFMDRFKS